MVYYPSEIDSSKQTLTRFSFSDMCFIHVHAYKYYIGKQKWKEIKHKLKNVCGEQK